MSFAASARFTIQPLTSMTDHGTKPTLILYAREVILCSIQH